MELEKLFNSINIQLKEEKSKYRRLKICKYSVLKLSKIMYTKFISTGLSFVSIFLYIIV